MAYEVSYPKAFPSASLSDVIQIVRSGEIIEQRSQLGLAEYNLQGFAQGIVLGNPDGPFGDAEPTEDQKEQLRECAAVLAQHTGYQGADFSKIDWKAVLKMAIEMLLAALLKEPEPTT